LLREAGGPSTGAARLLRELVRRGLDEDALVPAAMIAVELDSLVRPTVASLIGQRFGPLVVIGHAGRERHRLYWWHCDCGTDKKIRGDSSVRGTRRAEGVISAASSLSIGTHAPDLWSWQGSPAALESFR
jgi:hypothetical protein